MPPHLQINDRDLSAYMRVAHEDGLDPADSGYSEPQFSGSPAFGEGAAFVGDAVGNREIEVPLFLSAESEADLHQLIRDINQELTRGASVEYASSADGEITYFDLERGRLEVDYRYWISRAARTRAVLRLWTRPYGHTGTARALGTLVATHSIARFQATQISGDVDAEANISVGVPTLGANNATQVTGLIGGWGVKYPVPSGYSPVVAAGPLASSVTDSVASIVGASGVIASQYTGFTVTPTAPAQSLAFVSRRSQDVGRYRLLAFMAAASFTGATAVLAAYTADGRRMGYADLQDADLAGLEWRWRDLGEYTVTPSQVGQGVTLTFLGGSGVAVSATHGVRLNHLLALPVDRSVGLLVYNDDGYMFPANGVWTYQGVGSSNAWLTNATGIFTNALRHTRGAPLHLPAIPSGAPSGAAEITVFTTGGPESGGGKSLGGNAFTVSIEARERFTFLR